MLTTHIFGLLDIFIHLLGFSPSEELLLLSSCNFFYLSFLLDLLYLLLVNIQGKTTHLTISNNLFVLVLIDIFFADVIWPSFFLCIQTHLWLFFFFFNFVCGIYLWTLKNIFMTIFAHSHHKLFRPFFFWLQNFSRFVEIWCKHRLRISFCFKHRINSLLSNLKRYTHFRKPMLNFNTVVSFFPLIRYLQCFVFSRRSRLPPFSDLVKSLFLTILDSSVSSFSHHETSTLLLCALANSLYFLVSAHILFIFGMFYSKMYQRLFLIAVIPVSHMLPSVGGSHACCCDWGIRWV